MRFDIEEYISANLSSVKRSASGELNAECPFCNKPAHFYVNGNTGKFICFKCDARGRNVIGIVAQVEGLTYTEAAAFVMRRAVQFRRKESTETLLEKVEALRDVEREPAGPVEVDMPREFRPVWTEKRGWAMPVYLKERGFKKVTAKAWGLGFCNSGRYDGRVIIPVECPNGHSFTARDATGARQPRYLNPPGADHGRLLLGWKHAGHGDVIIVEGPLDAIKMWQHGLPSLALMGKVLHSEQLAMLFKHREPDVAVTVMLDPEEVRAPYDVANQLTCRFNRVYIARLPDGVDPGDSTKEQAHSAHTKAELYKGNRVTILHDALASSRKKLEGIYQ